MALEPSPSPSPEPSPEPFPGEPIEEWFAAGLLTHGMRPSGRKTTWLWKRSHALMPEGSDSLVAAGELEGHAGGIVNTLL
jgi:hypothetical protein